MKMMKRSLALLLCFLMLSSGPISAFATEGVSDNDNDDPVVCTVCGVENCETTHVYCDTCEKYDCGLTHTTCDKCGTVDCQSTHEAWCDTCKKDSCGVDHTTSADNNGETVSGNDVVGCTECGATEGHLAHCSQCVIPASVVCNLCGQSDGHVVGCFATFTEVGKTATFTEYPVALYYNPVTEPDKCKSFDESEFGENFTFTVQYSFPGDAGVTWYVLDTENWGIFADTDAPYSYIQSDYVTFDLETEDKTEQTLTDEGSGVRVSGYLPEGTSLSVESANLDDVAKVDPTFAHIQDNFKIYDISLMKDGTIHQPGETVSVTMDVRDVASIGEKVFVYHVHGNEDGTTETEILGPYTIDSEGEINFDMDKFSYVIVVNNDVYVKNIQAFYTVTGTSGNKHFHASCIYITNTGDVHMILTGNQTQAANCYATTVSVNDVPVKSLKETTNHGQVTSYVIRNAENENDVTEIVTSGSKYNYVIDINLGTEVSLNGQFNVSVTWNDGTINGFKIDGMKVTIVFNEGIQKTVYSVNKSVIDYTTVPLDYVPEVNAGDVIIYKIEVKNGEDSTQNLTCDISDILPEGLFDNNAILISQNLQEWWYPTSELEYGKVNIASNVNLKKGESATYYVKATVLDTATVGTYTNTARMSKSETDYKEDTADVQILIKCSDLTITKTGARTDLDENQSFIFDVVGPDGFKITVTINGDGSVTIKDLPIGEYTVTERTNWSWRYNPGDATKTIDLAPDESNTVTFNNSRTDSYWLSGDSCKENQFTVKSKDEE